MAAVKRELVSGGEFARRAGVKQTTVNQWTLRGVIQPEIAITNKIKFYAWPPKVKRKL